MKLLLAALLAIATALAGAAAPARADAFPLLKPSVTVQGPTVTLGDLFDGAGDKAALVVAHAPRPGQQGTISLAQVANAARLGNFLWRHSPGLAGVAVRRASRIVPQGEIEAAVAAALAKAGQPGPLDVQIRTPGLEFHVGVDQIAPVAVRDVDVGPNGLFTATVSVRSDDPAAGAVRISGQAFGVTRLPVLARPVGPGEVIGKSDIGWLAMRSDRIPSNIATGIEQMLGQSPRRPVPVGDFVRLSDLETPVVVAKGALVTMEVASGRMFLTASGQALEAGGDGALIRVANMKSRRIVHATVIGPNRVAVAALPSELPTQ